MKLYWQKATLIFLACGARLLLYYAPNIFHNITLQLSLSYSRNHRTCKGSEGGAPPLTTHCVRTPACPSPSPPPAPRAISAIECITAEPDTLLGSCSASCRGSQLTRHAEDTAVCVSSPTSAALDYCNSSTNPESLAKGHCCFSSLWSASC